MKVYLAADHGGYELKNFLIAKLKKLNYNLEDGGAYQFDPEDDYPDMIKGAIEKVAKHENRRGILCCRSGIGMSIMANRYPKIRAALCFNQKMAQMARQHNNANILCLGSDYVKRAEILKMVKIFLTTEFVGGRHQRRLNKINRLVKK
jgi:RpiB/LacA/LacB family sugar-phosphate isomerase